MKIVVGILQDCFLVIKMQFEFRTIHTRKIPQIWSTIGFFKKNVWQIKLNAGIHFYGEKFEHITNTSAITIYINQKSTILNFHIKSLYSDSLLWTTLLRLRKHNNKFY
ncbi:hypothetical protein RF11_12978 [Thelohanellus kitauei]|uniref:Uncharacterized protein n=1 Tax=Thelohanellus kitauei TaxID=669202 RepID=A0A0C2NDX7_THEKT|nr:hypothetical protein RF11_12978 [Thelohanellus kitauei]